MNERLWSARGREGSIQSLFHTHPLSRSPLLSLSLPRPPLCPLVESVKCRQPQPNSNSGTPIWVLSKEESSRHSRRCAFSSRTSNRKERENIWPLCLPPTHTHTSPSLPSALYLLAEWFTVTCLVNEIPRCLEGGTVNPSRAELVVIIVLQRRQVEVAQILSQKHTHTLSLLLSPLLTPAICMCVRVCLLSLLGGCTGPDFCLL